MILMSITTIAPYAKNGQMGVMSETALFKVFALRAIYLKVRYACLSDKTSSMLSNLLNMSIIGNASL